MKYLMAAAAALSLAGGGAAVAQTGQPYDDGYGPNGGAQPYYGNEYPDGPGSRSYGGNGGPGYGDAGQYSGDGQSYGNGGQSYGANQGYGGDPSYSGYGYQPNAAYPQYYGGYPSYYGGYYAPGRVIVGPRYRRAFAFGRGVRTFRAVRPRAGAFRASRPAYRVGRASISHGHSVRHHR